MPEHRTLHLSPSAITAFKACPTRFFYGYIEGLRPIEDTDSQRMGTNWHALHEVYQMTRRAGAAHLSAEDNHDAAKTAALAHLNEAYTTIPSTKTEEEWETERMILATCFLGYLWLYQNDEIETIVTELGVKLPVHHPKVGMPLPMDEVIRIGKLDRLVRINGRVCVRDYKSTSKSIDADSDFWAHLKLDTQISFYVMATWELLKAGELERFGIARTEEIGGGFYDVWHKPQIKPAKLNQGETAEFVKTGEYMGMQFTVTAEPAGDTMKVTVDGKEVEVDMGKKGYSIRETPGMYGARLLQDIYTRPDFYFARREIPRTEQDIRRFRGQLYATYQSMVFARNTGFWMQNEHSCRDKFPCAYIPICFNGSNGLEPGETPPGFKRIFTDLTVHGDKVAEQGGIE